MILNGNLIFTFVARNTSYHNHSPTRLHWFDSNWLELTRIDSAWLNLTWLDLTWLDLTWLDLTWLDSTRLDLTWLDLTRLDSLSLFIFLITGRMVPNYPLTKTGQWMTMDITIMGQNRTGRRRRCSVNRTGLVLAASHSAWPAGRPACLSVFHSWGSRSVVSFCYCYCYCYCYWLLATWRLLLLPLFCDGQSTMMVMVMVMVMVLMNWMNPYTNMRMNWIGSDRDCVLLGPQHYTTHTAKRHGSTMTRRWLCSVDGWPVDDDDDDDDNLRVTWWDLNHGIELEFGTHWTDGIGFVGTGTIASSVSSIKGTMSFSLIYSVY